MKRLTLALAPAARAEDAAALFKSKCAACHGPDGHGKTPMAEKIGAKDLRTAKGDVAKIIAEGKPGTKMVGFKGKLSDAQIQELAAYVKTLQ